MWVPAVPRGCSTSTPPLATWGPAPARGHLGEFKLLREGLSSDWGANTTRSACHSDGGVGRRPAWRRCPVSLLQTAVTPPGSGLGPRHRGGLSGAPVGRAAPDPLCLARTACSCSRFPPPAVPINTLSIHPFSPTCGDNGVIPVCVLCFHFCGEARRWMFSGRHLRSNSESPL